MALFRRWEPAHVLRTAFLFSLLFSYTRLIAFREFPPLVFLIQGGVVLLLCGWWIWKVYRRQGIARSPLALPAVALVMASVATTPFSVDPRISYASSLGLFAQVALFFLVCDLLLEGWSSNAFVDALLLIGGFVLVEALRVTAQWHWFWWVLQVPEYPLFPKPFRLFGVLSSPNLLAGQLILILPFAILKFGRARSSVGALVWGCWLLAADVVLFLTSCRGGWVATIVEVAICVGWLACRRECIREENAVGWIVERWRIWVAVATYVGLFGLLQILSSSASPLPIASHDNFSPQEPAGRIAIWAVAWQDFLSHPLVGSGPGTYPWILVSQTATSSGGVASPHSHNIFLEALAEQGVLGMIALVWGLLAAASTLGPALLRAVRTNRDAGSADSQLVVGVSADLASLQR